MLDNELVPTEALENRQQYRLSSIVASSAVRLEHRRIVFSGKTVSNSVKVDWVPEARIGDIDIYD